MSYVTLKLMHMLHNMYTLCVYPHVYFPLMISFLVLTQVYAPMTRTGVFLDAGSEKNAVHSQLTTTLEGLLTLEASLPTFITQPRSVMGWAPVIIKCIHM